jgi:type II secretory pathway pseudopilin PulG
MKRPPQSGFTLLEVLVIVTMIGLLTTIVLASLSVARNKGVDAAIWSSMGNLRTKIEQVGIQTNGQANYATICTNPSITPIIANVDAKNGGDGTNDYCRGTATAWVYASQLTARANTCLCVDSTGAGVTDSSCTIDVATAGTNCVAIFTSSPSS